VNPDSEATSHGAAGGDAAGRSTRAGAGVFATTHWSVVYSAMGEAEGDSAEALAQLCQSYWYPLYAYGRRMGQSPADAEDLTQGFFAKLLEKDYLRSAAREKGRFRTFLLTAFKRYMANEWDREHAGKRGGFTPRVSIDQAAAEERFSGEPRHAVQPDVLFDRHWAMALLDRTMRRLEEEYAGSGRAALFQHLQRCLAQEEAALRYQDIARELGTTEAGVKMAMQRFRARYRELLREEIAQTVASAEDLEAEMRHLFAAFG
jgi:RNA polymerase sigma-70 factor (ECF subfamily)